MKLPAYNRPKTLTEIINDKTNPPKPIIDNGVLLNGTILLIVGPAKSKKTFITQNLALAIAFGDDFAGFTIPKPKKVLYFLAEGGYFPNRERIQKMVEDIDLKYSDNLMLDFISYLYIDNDEAFEIMYKIIQELKPDVLILDPLIRFHDADENSASQVSQVFGRLRLLIEELGISIILVHHTGKVESRGSRGSSAIIGEYDSRITLHSEPNGNTRLSFDMRHVETPPSRIIRFNPDTFWFSDRDEISELLAKSGGCLPKDELIANYGKPQSTAYRHIDKSKENGYIKETEKGVLELA